MNWDSVIAPRTTVAGKLWFGVVLTVGLAIAAVWHAHKTGVTLDEIDAQNARFRAAQQAAARKPNRKEAEEAKRWAALRVERTFPWPRLLATVERAIDPEIELFELRPDPRSRSFVVKGHALTTDAIQRYLGLIAQDANVAQVYLMRQSTLERSNQRLLEFELRAVLRAY